METKQQGAKKNIKLVISKEKFDSYKNEAFKRLLENLELPGFRKGKVPEDVAKKHILRDRVFAEALDLAVKNEAYFALKDFAEQVIGKPEIKVLKAPNHSLREATGQAEPDSDIEAEVFFETLPEVSMDGWRDIKIARKEVEVVEQEIDASLTELRKSRATFKAVARPARKGDLVEVDFTSRVNGVVIEGGQALAGQARKQSFVLGEGGFLPGFEDSILGMKTGEEKNKVLTFPADWRNKAHAGKEADFHIILRNVQERILPELNDDFAKSIGRFESYGDLRKSVRAGLFEEKQADEKKRIRLEAVNILAKRVKDEDIPSMLVEQEIERLKNEFRLNIEQYGMGFEDYLGQLGKKEEDLALDFRGTALDRVKSALILRAIAKKENIKADPKEVELRAQKEMELLSRAREGHSHGEGIDYETVRAYTENSVLNEQVLEFIEGEVTKEN